MVLFVAGFGILIGSPIAGVLIDSRRALLPMHLSSLGASMPWVGFYLLRRGFSTAIIANHDEAYAEFLKMHVDLL